MTRVLHALDDVAGNMCQDLPFGIWNPRCRPGPDTSGLPSMTRAASMFHVGCLGWFYRVVEGQYCSGAWQTLLATS